MHAIRYLNPAHAFRADYDYDNVLYIAAGQLLEAVSGQRWETFMQRRVLDPLGMRDTQVSIDARTPDQVALHAEDLRAGSGAPARQIGPPTQVMTGRCGSLPPVRWMSSAADMGKRLRVQLDHGVMPDGKTLFSPAERPRRCGRRTR